jgi:error-prone DNA polymerase
VTVHAQDVNFSDWDNTLEPIGPGRFAVRLGLRQVDGMAETTAQRMIAARHEPFTDLENLKRRARLDVGSLRRLAAADAFRSMTLDRRQALWDARALRDAPDLPLFSDTRDEGAEARFILPAMPSCEHVVADYQTLRLSLKAHPMAFLRASMARQGYVTTVDLSRLRNRSEVRLAGLVLIRQRPGSAKGVCFITLEDELGVANLVIWPKVFEGFRKVIMRARLMDVRGLVQRDADVIHVVAAHLIDRSDAIDRLSNDPMAVPLARADEVRRPVAEDPRNRHPRDMRVIPKSRDFH